MSEFEMINRGPHADQINQAIRNFSYQPEDVMSFSGESIQSFVPRTATLKADTFVVVEKTKHNLTGQYDIAVPNAKKDITYPGALLLGNQKLVEGIPDPLVVKRRPMTITIDLPGLTDDNHVLVDRVDFTGVSRGVNELLNNWLSHKSETFSIPANMQYKKSILYDKKSMALTFGCDVEYLQGKLGINFSSISEQETSAYLIQFRQIYYTVSSELPAAPADVFADEVSWDELMHKIDVRNPPCYVQNVQYGREVYLLFQSSMSSEELKGHLDASISFNGGALQTTQQGDFSQLEKNINCTIVTMGGKPVAVSGNLATDNIIAKVNDLISEHAVLSAENPAFPLAYTVAFLKDNRIASIQGSTEYITSTSTTYHAGLLNLQHWGAYVARFDVNWEEVTYDTAGNEAVTQYSWQENGHQVTAGFTTDIPLPANARNIRVRAQGATGLAWDPWRTSLERTFPLIPRRSIILRGTTLNQSASVTPEQ